MPQKMNWFIRIAVLEAISYLLLLGIAMPLKYLFDYPMAVTVVGWAHGVLFVLYLAFLVMCWRDYDWNFKRLTVYFAASLLPVAPFYIKRNLAKEYDAYL
jgi:integral membrane protein